MCFRIIEVHATLKKSGKALLGVFSGWRFSAWICQKAEKAEKDNGRSDCALELDNKKSAERSVKKGSSMKDVTIVTPSN
ncbi:hypothetical protein [Marinococcus halotolerans]|uniref:hypothetical protein n=1 Tax=Marinococcus halotolerans TaxID=301092 RepID=UPI0003B75D94|nr:hypothetical protein [Marinococcus halotolerans]